ncbi:hypothetical protein D3C87_1525030 [compost metagenome]
MHGLQEVRHAVIGVVIDEDGAEQRLFSLDVVRRLAVMRFRRLRGGDLSHSVVHGLRDLPLPLSLNLGFGFLGHGSQ